LKKLRALILAMTAILITAASGAGILTADALEYDFDKIDKDLAEDVETHHIPAMAVIVVDKDKVLFCKTYGGCKSEDTPFIIGSMSKSFTALAIMQLAEAGKIDLNKSASEYIDMSRWFRSGEDYKKITVKDLLNQTSGFTTFQQFGELEIGDRYGSYYYANANYGLLGLIVEAVSGETYEDYINTHIFKPLGMDHSAVSLDDSKRKGLIEGYRNWFGLAVKSEPDFPSEIKEGRWTNVPAGYLSASIADLGRYLQMYLNGGQNIASAESIQSMFLDSAPCNDEDSTHRYGMGWNTSEKMFAHPMIWHEGLVENYTSNMLILPEEGIAVAVLVNMNDYLIGNGLLGNVAAPLIGEEREAQPHTYLLMHIALDLICLLTFAVSLFPLLTVRRWRNKEKKVRSYVIDILRHIILPTLLLLLPAIAGVPFRVLWLFVKDLFFVITVSAALLICVGIYKLIYLIKNH
jgi:CubicO group peptidase (beta-lactamase class C family)